MNTTTRQEDPMPDTDVRPFIRQVTVPMAPAITEAHHGPMVTARLIIRGVHHCQGSPTACLEECHVIIGGVLIDPDAPPGADPVPTLGWIEPANVHQIIAALLAATPTPGEVAA